MKIISGGQTGADRAALDAASELRFKTGGFAPKNFLTENGSDYFLQEFGLIDSGKGYVERTELNVLNSDITIWFGNNDTPGFLATKRACKNHKKEFYDVTDSSSDTIYKIISHFNIVNVAGNRASKNPDIYFYVFNMMKVVLGMVKSNE